MSTKEYEDSPPEASALLEALRSVGYSLQTAIADLIDNSITAGAKNVWLNFFWDGSDSYLTIKDDGGGMTEAQLSAAMKPGSRNPREERDPEDLGRFGLGLKTASFSQCRRLTVASKASRSSMAVRRWDLDHVYRTDAWQLLLAPAIGSEERIAEVKDVTHGTLVLWECMDRVVGNFSVGNERDHKRFLKQIDNVEAHLAMVFHRFLEGSRPVLRIFINGTEAMHRVKPWDPFLRDHKATVPTACEPIPWGDDQITIQGFILPHKDRLTDEDYENGKGIAGWNGQQGFYIYRNQRLLVAGSWLDLGYTKEEQYKLARIMVDIPNSMDSEWEIDVKKSRARPPARLRSRLMGLAENVRKRAREVYAHRGAYGQRGPLKPVTRVWQPVNRKGRLTYQIDRDHPLVKDALDMPQPYQSLVKGLLRLLEETVPVQQIWLDAAEKPDLHARPYEGTAPKEVQDVLMMTYQAIRKSGLAPEAARLYLGSLEPFNEYPALVGTLSDLDE